MNIRDLSYLQALADHRHFGKAANACFVSQPALSMQIKKLEQELGVQLLERTNKSVTLTPIGIVLADKARLILQQTEEMREIAKLAKDPYAGEVKIGIIPTLAPYLLPYIIPELNKAFPRLSIYLQEEKTLPLMENLKLGKLDTAIMALPILDLTLRKYPLFEEEFMLMVPKSHAFTKLKSINPAELKHKTLLLLEEGHCIREQALNFCVEISAKENQNFRATSLETLRYMITAGAGITLMPKLACIQNESISYLNFKASKPMRTIGQIWRKSTPKEKVLIDIAHQIKKIMAKHTQVTVID